MKTKVKTSRREYTEEEKLAWRLSRIKESNYDTFRSIANVQTTSYQRTGPVTVAPNSVKALQYITNVPHIKVRGADVASFRDKIRRGISATSTYDLNLTSLTKTGGYTRYVYRDIPSGSSRQVDYFRTSGRWTAAWKSPTPVPGSKDDEAKSHFIRKSKKVQRSVLGGEFVKDLHKSLRTFSGLRETMLNALNRQANASLEIARRYGLDHTKLTKGSRLKQVELALLENWTAFSFGVLPTYHDLIDIGFGLWRANSKFREGTTNQYVSGKSKWKEVESSQTNVAIGTTPLGWSDQYKTSVTTTYERTRLVKYYGAIRVRFDETGAFQGRLFNTANEMGLSLQDFIPTVWECIPFSWAVDYFTNIGQICEAAAFPRGDICWVNRLERCETSVRTMYGPVTPANPVGIKLDVFHNEPVVFTNKQFERIGYNGDLVPSLRFHLPYRRTDWLNMLAVIGSKVLHLQNIVK